jgi:branched-subunit amino acid ABC-type transport system permease component
MLGAMILGFAENLGLFFDFAGIINVIGIINITDSVQVPIRYKSAISFVILLIILLIKPSGITGLIGKRKGGDGQ